MSTGGRGVTGVHGGVMWLTEGSSTSVRLSALNRWGTSGMLSSIDQFTLGYEYERWRFEEWLKTERLYK